MEQFSLEKWLKNKSRKVMTRSGHNVRILCTDQRGNMPIVAIVEFETLDGVQIFYSDGKNESHREYDLFFADEEVGLTEFEKQLGVYFYFPRLSSGFNEEEKKYIKDAANTLISLARKEIENSIENDAVEFAKFYMEDVNPSFEKVKESEELWKWKMSCLGGINKAYTKGKQDALKNLPKWKKITKREQNYLAYGYLSHDGYYLSIQELKDKLPKEE